MNKNAKNTGQRYFHICSGKVMSKDMERHIIIITWKGIIITRTWKGTSSSSQGMPGNVAVPYYTFPGVSIFGFLPGRVFSEVDRFQIILHCPQPGAIGAASLALPSEGS